VRESLNSIDMTMLNDYTFYVGRIISQNDSSLFGAISLYSILLETR